MRDYRFTFVCSELERALISDLADLLHRSQSDAVRYAIQKVFYELAQRHSRFRNSDFDRNLESQENGLIKSIQKESNSDRAPVPG